MRRLLTGLLFAICMGAGASAPAAPAPDVRALETAPTEQNAPPPPAKQPDIVPERTIGRPDAPVTIIEYASMTCPHCRAFHQEVLPRLKADFIDTGKVRLIFRDFPLDRLALAASMLARCVEAEKSLDVTAHLFETQAEWSYAENPLAALTQEMAGFGLNEEQVRGCVTDEAKGDAIIAEAIHGQETYEITSTPTFVVNGDVLVGLQTYEAMQAAITAAGE